MPLTPCKECGKEISDKAVTCPNCGIPIPKIVQSNLDSSSLGKTKITSPLIPCRTCETDVFQKAYVCPNCGIRNPDIQENLKTNIFVSQILFTFLLIANYDVWFRWSPFFEFLGNIFLIINLCGWVWYLHQK